MNKDTLINFRVNKELKDEFQSVLDTEGFTISEVLEATMNDIVRKQNIPINIKTKIKRKPKPILSIPFIKQCLEEILQSSEKNKVRAAYLFGSYSKGTANSNSDVDLFIEVDSDYSLFDLADLINNLEKILGKKVDIATNSKDSYFMSHIAKERIQLYVRES